MCSATVQVGSNAIELDTSDSPKSVQQSDYPQDLSADDGLRLHSMVSSLFDMVVRLESELQDTRSETVPNENVWISGDSTGQYYYIQFELESQGRCERKEVGLSHSSYAVATQLLRSLSTNDAEVVLCQHATETGVCFEGALKVDRSRTAVGVGNRVEAGMRALKSGCATNRNTPVKIFGVNQNWEELAHVLGLCNNSAHCRWQADATQYTSSGLCLSVQRSSSDKTYSEFPTAIVLPVYVSHPDAEPFLQLDMD